MTTETFSLLFGVTWVAAAGYALSATMLLNRVTKLKAQGRAGDAPDPMRHPLELIDYMRWLLTGRYGELGDATVTRWASIARPLFIVALPLMLAVFVIVFTQPDMLA